VPPHFLEVQQPAERRAGASLSPGDKGLSIEDEGLGLRWFKWCQGLKVERLNDVGLLVAVTGREVSTGGWFVGVLGQGLQSQLCG
jgi:hypothetical protein